MKYFKALLSIIFLASASPALADHEDLVHLTAHVGASYALQTVFYGFNNKVLKINKLDSEGLAFLSTMAIGYLYKLSENASSQSVAVAMSENMLGSFLAIGTHLTFHF